MVFQLEIPDDQMKSDKKWGIKDLMSCSQCNYKTPDAGCYVTHVYGVHGKYYATDEEQTKYADTEGSIISKTTEI